MAGQENTLSDERIEKLKALDFLVVNPHEKGKTLVSKNLAQPDNFDHEETEDEISRGKRVSPRQPPRCEARVESVDEAESVDEEEERTETAAEDDDSESMESHCTAPEVSRQSCKICKKVFNSFLEAMAHEAQCSGFTDKMRKSGNGTN